MNRAVYVGMIERALLITMTSWWARWRLNHRLLDGLIKRLFRRRTKKTSKLRVTGLCEGNSPVTGEFPSKRTSNAENVFIWWRHHVTSTSAQYQRNSACIALNTFPQKSLATLQSDEKQETSIWNGHNIANTACILFKFGTMNNRYMLTSKPMKIWKI